MNVIQTQNNDEVKTPAEIRKLRQSICFSVINRGRFWYDTLTRAQESELWKWYCDWLDAPKTLKIPATPEWVHNKVEGEEILL